MAVTFNTNVSALTAQRYLGAAGDATASSLAKLSSGSRVPTAKDDAAGLAIGTKLKAEVAGLQQASNNASQAISLLQIADGALSTVSDILQRMKSLAVQASSGQLSDADRGLLNQEFTNLKSEVDRIANITNFNGTNLLNGSTNTVVANKNNLVTTSTDVAAETLVSEGVQSITFDSGFSADAVKLEFDAANNTLKLTNLNTGQSDVATVSATAIASGSTETVTFNTLGATVILDENFDKSVSSSLQNAYRTASYTDGGADSGDVTNARISEFRFKDGSGLTAKDLNGVTITVTSAGTNGDASTAAATIGGKSFTLGTGVTADLSAAGSYTLTLVDSDGNELDLSFTAAAAIDGGFTVAATTTGINYGSYADVELSDVATTGGGAITGSGTTSDIAFTINSTSFNGTGNVKRSDLNGLTITTSETAGVITFGNVTVNGSTFTAGGTMNNVASGTKDVTFSDGQGNSFVLRGVSTTGDTDGNDTIADITLANADSSAPGVDEESVRLVGITKGSASTFDFGDIDDATVAFNAATANSSSASITLNGTTFSATGIDLSTVGAKTVTLTNGSGTSATSITVSFNLTGALDDGDALTLEVGELGQVVGANTVTGGSTTFSFKVGTGVSTNDSVSFALSATTTSELGISASSIDTASNADTAITAVNSAINTVASRRADVGAAQSRLQFAADSIAVAIENTSGAQSALLDVDVSSEITTFTSKQVLLQAGVSLLAQANQQPALLLRLLQ